MGLQSVTNAVRVLKAFSSQTPEWGVTELANHLDLGKSSTHRLLTTLSAERMLDQNPVTGKYRLGLAVFDLAAAVPRHLDLHEAVLAPMTALRNQTGETVQVAVLDGREVVYIERLDSPNTLRMFLEVGRRIAANATGTGKALLAFLPAERRRQLLDGWTMERRTASTITDPVALERELGEVRRRGYATNRHEAEVGVVSIAAPIRDRSTTVVAAISVAGPSDRIESAELELAQLTMQTAAAISRRLGFRTAS